jgi:hypothetical protein
MLHGLNRFSALLKANNFRLLCLALLIVSLTLTGCPPPTSSYYDESRIENIMYNIKRAFNDHDIYALMQYIHPEYLHDGMNRWEVRELWLDRMSEHLLIDFQNVQIVIDDENAYVGFTMKLINEFETTYSEEPQAHGDLSYFLYDHGDWYVYGNRHYYKSSPTTGNSEGSTGTSPTLIPRTGQ